MPNSSNEPSLTPSADSPGQKAEKARAGKSVAAIIGAIAVVFLIIFVGIIGHALIFGLSQ
ncbi:hypothetical protein HB780_21010 [Rhizobium lusitanum]|uniref:hypothetical protein n=1 Tax=Rhizobium lusitanum TaxID=293958 RepID=UPI001611D522|nr:hypothetical protein [Rhizobium lusitanum]QND48118.1 hypothetical protein HB780_21010 [Rhizobium lusitanum]